MNLKDTVLWLYGEETFNLFCLQGIWVMRRIVHTNVSTREVLKIILFLYVVLFVVSIPWNWMALYQQVGSIMQNTICALSLSLYL